MAKDFNTEDRPDLFKSTPPIEAMRLICSEAATGGNGGPGENCIMVNDVRRAFFYAKAMKPLWVELPEEDYDEKDEVEDRVGLLDKSLYGTRDAAVNWGNTVEKHLKKIGFRQGIASDSLYYHKAKGISTLVHGDDYVSVAGEAQLKWLEKELEKAYEIKTSLVGKAKSMSKEVRVLNRIIRWTPQGWEYEADQRHGEIIVRETEMEDATPTTTPSTEDKEEAGDQEELKQEGSRWYRGVAARGNYLSLDRPDMAYASKEASKKMSKPAKGDMRRLKRMGRYLKGSPRLVQEFPWQGKDAELRVYTDADWGGCKATRKSTSGGAVMRGAHCIKFWSKTQASITLSTAEAELVALVKGTCEAKGVASIMKDLVEEEVTCIGVYTDASAAIGMVQRQGMGRVRHIDVGLLWVQQHQKANTIDVRKVPGQTNPADVFTKAVPAEVMWRHVRALGFKEREGRAEEAVILLK